MIERASIVVTGGLGAIGSALCRRLLALDVRSLTVIDDGSSSVPELSRDILDDARTTFIRGSITDEAALAKAFSNGADVVFHLAAHFANQNSVEHPVEDALVNSVGTVRVLEHARGGGTKKFVFASSSCVYGSADRFDVDTRDFQLDTPYAVNKLHGEHLVRFYHEYHGLNTTILRYFNSFGPGELPGPYRNVVPNFFALAMRGEPLPITGDPLATRDFNYVDNTVQATMLAAEKGVAAGKTYNVGSGEETSIGDLAEEINRIAGNSAGIALKPSRSWDHVRRRRADIARTIAELGYEPANNKTAQLHSTYEWLCERRTYFGVI